MELTREMIDWFEERTRRHISLVEKWFEELAGWKLFDHDGSKFEEPERDPYVIISWDYKCRNEGVEFDPPEEAVDQMDQASFHHITHNPHHPEYWDPNPSMHHRGDISEEMVDATSMDNKSIVEMCADWMAMSEELQNSPLDWAEQNVNKKWKFTEDQVKLIDDCLAIWK